MYKEFTLKSNDNISHFCRGWIPDDKPIAKVIMIHGKGEHSIRYMDFGEYLANKGFAAYMPDLRGHGRTDNKVGITAPRKLILKDIKMFIDYINNEHPDLPLFMYGHSLGGNIALSHRILCKDDNIMAYVISSPWLKLKVEFSKFTIKFIKLLSKLFPNLTMKAKIDLSSISSIKEEQIIYQNEELMNFKISLLTASDVYTYAGLIFENSLKIDTPFMLIHGTDDSLIDIEGSRRLAALCKDTVKYKEFTGNRHEILHDISRINAMEDMADYMLSFLQ